MEKRNRRIVSFGGMTQRFIRKHNNPTFNNALLAGLPRQLFGDTVAAQIESSHCEDGVFILVVPHAAWRQELMKHRSVLLARAQEIQPEIRKIRLQA